MTFATVLCLIPENVYGRLLKIMGNGLAPCCKLFYRKIYGYFYSVVSILLGGGGGSGGAMVLGKLPVPGRPLIWITIGQGPPALVVGAGGGCFENFTLIYPFLALWETARYRLKYCLKGPLNPKQPTNQSIL